MKTAASLELGNFLQKIDEIKSAAAFDLSNDENVAIVVMNLISIEEHLFFSGAKTGKTRYYDLLREVRETRKILLKKLIQDYEGEVWCISKHLLAASMRLMEVGTKQQTMNNKEEARALFEKANGLFSLFWEVNNRKKVTSGNITNKNQEMPARLNKLVADLLNCCEE